MRKKVFLEVGGFDEENLAVAFNDVDLCLKLSMAGYLNVYTPFAELIHHESISRGSDMEPEKAERFSREAVFMKEKWKDIIMMTHFIILICHLIMDTHWTFQRKLGLGLLMQVIEPKMSDSCHFCKN